MCTCANNLRTVHIYISYYNIKWFSIHVRFILLKRKIYFVKILCFSQNCFLFKNCQSTIWLSFPPESFWIYCRLLGEFSTKFQIFYLWKKIYQILAKIPNIPKLVFVSKFMMFYGPLGVVKWHKVKSETAHCFRYHEM